jgi:hypothetical protein
MSQLILPGTAGPGDVLSGKTFSAGTNYGATGTMPNNGAVIITPGATNQPIAAGYHNGSGYVKGDANLVPANIKSGVSIFGIAGTGPGKLFAIGSTPVSSNSTQYTVSGLAFQPNFVAISYYYTNSAYMMAMWANNSVYSFSWNNYWYTYFNAMTNGYGYPNITPTSNGFTFTTNLVYSATTACWIASQ